MDLQEEYDDQSFIDYQHDDKEDINHRKQVKRMLDDRLEKKRLKKEFEDDFDELSGDFDWDWISK